MGVDIKFWGGELTYSQEADCCDDSFSDQIIKISAVNGGGGMYYYLSTERWAFDSVEQLADFLNKAVERLVDGD